MEDRLPVIGVTNLGYIHKQHVMRYVFAGQFVADKRVLDVGCGYGYGANYLARKGAREVVGLDVSPDAIHFAKEHYSRQNLSFTKGDFLLFNDKRKYDVVVAFEVIEHVSNAHAFLDKAKSLLRRNGLLICSTPNKRYSMHPPYHVREYLPYEFWALLSEHFSYVEKYVQGIPLPIAIQDKLVFLAKKLISYFPNTIAEGIRRLKKKHAGESRECGKVLRIDKDTILAASSESVIPYDALPPFYVPRILVGVCTPDK